MVSNPLRLISIHPAGQRRPGYAFPGHVLCQVCRRCCEITSARLWMWMWHCPYEMIGAE